MKTCSVQDCSDKHFARGYCRKHYERWKRNGDPLFLHRPGGDCTVTDCSDPRWALALCKNHYRRFRKYGDPLGSAPPPKRKDPIERFFSMVEKTETCWLWTGGVSRTGYGNFWFDGRTVSAHRFAYTQLVGLIPGGLDIDHLCRNRRCVNPAHMEPVTEQVNTLRGTSPSALNSTKTHCKNGHEFTPENTRVYRWMRVCKACRRESAARARARARGASEAP